MPLHLLASQLLACLRSTHRYLSLPTVAGTTWAPPLIGLCASADKARASAAPTPQRAGILHIARVFGSVDNRFVFTLFTVQPPCLTSFSVILSAAPFPRASCARLCACGPSSSRQCTPCAFHLAVRKIGLESRQCAASLWHRHRGAGGPGELFGVQYPRAQLPHRPLLAPHCAQTAPRAMSCSAPHSALLHPYCTQTAPAA